MVARGKERPWVGAEAENAKILVHRVSYNTSK